MEKKDNRWYIKLLTLLKLETTSRHGRVNLAGVIIVTMFCLIYSASDVVRHVISAVEDVVKSIALDKDIYHKYESVSVIDAVVPIIIVIVLCLIFLSWHEHMKRR